jgi:hypothetical protein
MAGLFFLQIRGQSTFFFKIRGQSPFSVNGQFAKILQVSRRAIVTAMGALARRLSKIATKIVHQKVL